MDALDPEQDWAEIYKLMSTYESSEFILDFLYAYTFPHFMVPYHGSEPVWRNGEKPKVVVHGYQRSEDTNHHNMIWAHYGPDHPETRSSVNTINKIHAHYAKDYPNGFIHHDDYVHVWTFSAALMHRVLRQLALPGYSDKQKIVAHRFWKEMAPLFVVPGDDRPIDGYPGDFDGVLAWIAEYEGRSWPRNEPGALASHAVVEQFLHRHVWRPFRPAIRTLLYSLWPASMLTAYGIAGPSPLFSAVLRRSAGLALMAYGMLTSDASENYVERRADQTTDQRRAHRRHVKDHDESFAEAFTAWLRRRSGKVPESTTQEPAVPTLGCPHPMGQQSAASA